MSACERRLRKALAKNWEAILKERDHTKAAGLHRERARLAAELREERQRADAGTPAD